MAARAKSFTYTTSVVWEKGLEGTLSAPDKPDVSISAPPEFRGPEGSWTPESLFVASVEACLMFTFLALARARARRLDFAGYRSRAEGLLELVHGQHVVSTVTVRPTIVVKTAQDVEKAREIVARMEANCFISNSIESSVVIEPEIVVEDR